MLDEYHEFSCSKPLTVEPSKTYPPTQLTLAHHLLNHALDRHNPSFHATSVALTQYRLLTTPPSLPIIATACSDLRTRIPISSITSPYPLRRPAPRRSLHLRLGLHVPGILVRERALIKIDHNTALATLKLNLLAPIILIEYCGGITW
jgi:hypothetical protein